MKVKKIMLLRIGKFIALIILILLSFGCTITDDNKSQDLPIHTDTETSLESSYTDDEKLTALPYNIVDTSVVDFYSDYEIISAPSEGEAFYGQDAQYIVNSPSYTDNQDGTITDNITGLMWQQNMDKKMTYTEAVEYAKSANLGGYSDWRIPTIKELYSLIIFTGTVDGQTVSDNFFIDTKYFNQPIGDVSLGEREIDAQTWSSTFYVGKTMDNDTSVFGVNFLDGRIKSYPLITRQEENEMYFRLVRGNPDYGKNEFVDNGDGTITDFATGLMWQKQDSVSGMDWEDALYYCEELTLAGNEDWRLPNAKELQSIVEYTSNSPAIDDIFEMSQIKDTQGNLQYPYFWTSTTHLDGINPYAFAVYIAFGQAQGFMNEQLMDVHGAGAQRSDPKSKAASDYPSFFGPQGDLRMVNNYVRAVRNVN